MLRSSSSSTSRKLRSAIRPSTKNDNTESVNIREAAPGPAPAPAPASAHGLVRAAEADSSAAPVTGCHGIPLRTRENGVHDEFEFEGDEGGECVDSEGTHKPLRLARVTRSVTGRQVQVQSYTEQDCSDEEDPSSGSNETDDFLTTKFKLAFGEPFNVDEHELESDDVRPLWWEAVGLRGKQYELPNGRVGTRFVHVLAEEIERFVAGRQNSERQLLFTSLVLQRDKMVKKGKDIRPLLTRRMDMWEEGKLQALLHEAKRCDRQLATGHRLMTCTQLERSFNRMMLQGRVRAAVRLLTDRGGSTVLNPEAEAIGKDGPLGKTCLEAFREKHPPQKEPDPRAFVECKELPPFEHVDITSSHIETVARRLQGSAGPGGTDADQWKSFLLRFGKASERLREATAASTRLHANEIVPWASLRALLARRGVALDKQPGVRPIGVGECLQRLEAKAMALATGEDASRVCGADQLCAGSKAGIEAAAHAMHDIFNQEDTEAVLLVDAANAFNSISRPALLWNCRVLWPRCSIFLFNCYRGSPSIILRGHSGGNVSVLFSHEGTTQGCPLSMLAYAVGILPLVRSLKDPEQHDQVWYADDSSCGGLLSNICRWFQELRTKGPDYGYFAEPSKSIIVVKEQFFGRAKELFDQLNVEVVLANRFLGGCIGREDGVRDFVGAKVTFWVGAIKRLAEAAATYPQSAYSAFTKSLSMEWTHLQRVVSGCDELYVPLRDAIQGYLTPSLFGREILQNEHGLLALPVKKGGLALRDPVTSAEVSYRTSKAATFVLQTAVKTGQELSLPEHTSHCQTTLREARSNAEKEDSAKSAVALDSLPAPQKRTLCRIIKGEASGWLTVLPLASDGFDLSATQFRDQLAIRYRREPVSLPSSCDGCGAPFSLQHGLDCAKGGLIKRGHDGLRDNDAGLADLAWGGVSVEPILQADYERLDRPCLQADWMVRGVWEGNRVAFFDERIIDADAPSYLQANLTWEAISNRAAQAKKRKYQELAEELRASFTPLVCSTDCVLHAEFAAYQKRLAHKLSTKWQRPYSVVMAWVRARTQFSIIRAVDLRLRGSRRRIVSFHLQDGSPLGGN